MKSPSRNGRPSTQRGAVTRRDSKPAATRRSSRSATIGDYLIQRLADIGVETIFGIPGDYVLSFYDALTKSPIRVIGTTREDCAGFAADAYARVHGIGALCVTYCVGGLNVVNPVAGAYAEKSPLVVISGAPGLNERARNSLLHHKVRDFDTQREVFEKITVANAVLDDPLTALREIDRVLEAVMRYKRPGYIELPRDQVSIVPPPQTAARLNERASDPKEMDEAVRETIARLEASARPLLLVGVEVHRFGLQDLVLKFAEKHELPICSTLLGKSAISETHPLFVGVYEGAMGRDAVREFVETSDCVLMLGTFMTDINLGIDTAKLDPARCILATSEDVRVSYHHFPSVDLVEFVRKLGQSKFACSKRELPDRADGLAQPFVAQPKQRMTVRRLFHKINTILTENMVVICDVGDSLFAGADLVIQRRTEFLSPAYYTSMGFAVPAALGVLAADPTCRPVVLVGDGAFQMTAMELSTMVRHKMAPIVFVLNNKGYSTERFIKDGPFNDIGDWSYHRLPELIGGGWGFEVDTETDLEKAIEAALANRDSFSLLNVHLDPHDKSDAMERLGRRLAARVRESAGKSGNETAPRPQARRKESNV